MTSPLPAMQPSRVEPGLVTRAIEVAGRLANDATDVIAATAGHGPAPAPFDWVTDTAGTLERHTRRVLTAEFPGVAVAGAEFDVGEDDPLNWVVTPVDGLANYRSGLPWCAYSLALLDRDGPLVGVVADPYRGQIHAAARGRGARANGTPVRLADQGEHGATVLCVEVAAEAVPPAGLAARARAAGCALRMLGSPALALVQVALGSADAAVLPGYGCRDVAGGVALVVEAGATVAALPGCGGLLVAAPGVADEVLGWCG